MKFSFVMLTWNRSKFLDLSLRALLASIEYPEDCEIIVMDNGSTDETPQVLSRFAHENSNIRIVSRDRNYGLNAYKKLLALTSGEYIVTLDDDVLELPPGIDSIFADYMQVFPDYGYLAFNVVQNESTNGAKPGPECYTDIVREGRTLEHGPAGGWCACFRRAEYKKLWLRVMLKKFDMSSPEDGFIINQLRRKLDLKAGLIKHAVCFHACGPEYARQYGHLDREIQKYSESGLQSFVDTYTKFLGEKDT